MMRPNKLEYFYRVAMLTREKRSSLFKKMSFYKNVPPEEVMVEAVKLFSNPDEEISRVDVKNLFIRHRLWAKIC